MSEHHSESSGLKLESFFLFILVFTNSPDASKQNRSKPIARKHLLQHTLYLPTYLWGNAEVSTAEQWKQQPQRAGFIEASPERCTFHKGTDRMRAFTHKKSMQCFQPLYFIGAVSVDFHNWSTKSSIASTRIWQHLCYLAGEVLTLGCLTGDFMCPCHGSPEQIFNLCDLPGRSGWGKTENQQPCYNRPD